MNRWLPLLVLLTAGALSGCASGGAALQRATQGPTADEVWLARFFQGYARWPTFDEKVAWKDGFESRVLAYLSRRPEVATSPRAGQFRLQRAVMDGRTKDAEVLFWETVDICTLGC